MDKGATGKDVIIVFFGLICFLAATVAPFAFYSAGFWGGVTSMATGVIAGYIALKIGEN